MRHISLQYLLFFSRSAKGNARVLDECLKRASMLLRQQKDAHALVDLLSCLMDAIHYELVRARHIGR